MAHPTDEQIRIRAHHLWKQSGKPIGREQEFWHKAERELLAMEDLREIANAPPLVLPGEQEVTSVLSGLTCLGIQGITGTTAGCAGSSRGPL